MDWVLDDGDWGYYFQLLRLLIAINADIEEYILLSYSQYEPFSLVSWMSDRENINLVVR